MLYSLIDSKEIFAVILVVLAFFGAFFSLRLFRGVLPRDHGKDFAIDGQQSAGKYTGSGVIFVTVFALVCALVVPMNLERIIYLAGIYLSMLSGFLDDSAKVPWGRVKKGLLDLVIAFSMYCSERLTFSLCCEICSSTLRRSVLSFIRNIALA